MTDAELIRELGIRPAARILNRRHTTVQGWAERDRIADPDARKALAEALAARLQAKADALKAAA